jgi:3-dehydrosphinganine reductase
LRSRPSDQHVYITGGSSGLGLALAVELAARGAHISLVARDEVKLAQALSQVQSACVSELQRVETHAFSIDSAGGAEKALEAAAAAHDGHAPDAVFLCAGAAHPGFWIETSAEDLTRGMQDGYWLQAWSAWVSIRFHNV